MPSRVSGLTGSERDHDNLRAAIRWAVASDEKDLAAELCGALWILWQVRGYLSEGRGWLDKVLAHAEHISPPALASAMRGAGELARAQGDYQEAASLHERSLAIFTDLDDREGMAESRTPWR